MRGPADESEPDSVLVARFRRGDPDVFDLIVERYRRDVYRISYRMTGSHEEADDVAQETFLRAWGALRSFRGDSALKTWLFRIAMNLSINLGRSISTRRTQPLQGDPPVRVRPGAIPETEKELLDDEEARRLKRAVETLPPRQRQVVILHAFEEMAFGEIARVLDCPVGTAKANYFHAMNNLRKALA